MNKTSARRLAMRHLVDYWRARPEAADTLEGILSWWIPTATVTAQAVRDALERLIAEGTVETAVAADGRVRFRLTNPTPVALSGLIARAQIEISDN